MPRGIWKPPWSSKLPAMHLGLPPLTSRQRGLQRRREKEAPCFLWLEMGAANRVEVMGQWPPTFSDMRALGHPVCPSVQPWKMIPLSLGCWGMFVTEEGTVYPRDVVPTVGWVQASRVGQGARLRKTSQ